MNGNVLEEGLKRGIVEMGDEMRGVLWKIERSRDISNEGLKVTVLKGFESMSRVMESAMKRVGERLVEEGRRRDRVVREIEERMCRLEERLIDKERERKSEERRRGERLQEMERTLEEGKVSNGEREERLLMLEKRVSKKEEGGRKVSAGVTSLIGRVEVLIKEKDERERQERMCEEERMEKEREENGRLCAVEVGLKALEVAVKEKEADKRKGRESAHEEVMSEELD